MKNAALFILTSILIIVCASAYLFVDLKITDYNFSKIRKGMHLSEVMRILGKPDKIYNFSRNEVRLNYNPTLPVSEYNVFYNTKDDLVTMTWSD